MKISTRARYGTRAMLDLAIHYGEGPVLTKDIARRQGFSRQYLEQLLITLKVAGLVRSARGTRGGFTLARPPSETKLSEIIEVMEGSMAPVDCVDAPDAYPRVDHCAVRDVWVEMKRVVNSLCESITLQDLAEQQLQKEMTTKINSDAQSNSQNCDK